MLDGRDPKRHAQSGVFGVHHFLKLPEANIHMGISCVVHDLDIPQRLQVLSTTSDVVGGPLLAAVDVELQVGISRLPPCRLNCRCFFCTTV